MSFAEPIAEFVGTMVLVMLGTGGNAQGVLFDNENVSTASAGVRLLFISFDGVISVCGLMTVMH